MKYVPASLLAFSAVSLCPQKRIQWPRLTACIARHPQTRPKSNLRHNPKKGRGRPATGKAPLVGVRMTEEFQEEIKAWAKRQTDSPALAPAIRRLVELGLTVKTPARPVGKVDRSLRAQELAAKAIDKIDDPAAHPEERAQRRRRLTKGPEEFREVRVDRAKAK
jgi:hypothetical protein